METIVVLRVEHSVISKELNRFRACDSETRCFYCREWALYVYKKHFVWSAKTQEEVNLETPDKLWAGKYQISLLNATAPTKKKERSPRLSERFEKLLDMQWDYNNNDVSLTEDIISACALWQTLPSSLSALPPIFEPLQFNPYPDAIPLVDDPKEPAQLLDPLIIERQALCLPADSFHLLKNLTGDILLSHTRPRCGHTKPESLSPSDLEIERAIYNDKLEQASKAALKELESSLDSSWRHLTHFLDRLLEVEKERNDLMGKRARDTQDQFVDGQHLRSFQEYCAEHLPTLKKKSTTVEQVDNVFDSFFQQFVRNARSFKDDFALPRLNAHQALIQKLWDLVVPTIQEMADRMASHEERSVRHIENYKAVSASLKMLYPAEDVDQAIKKVETELAERMVGLEKDIDHLLHMLHTESKPGVAGRLEMIGQKDFKKRVKKAESAYKSMRDYFKNDVTGRIFPEPLFCKFCLVCIEALMQEGEIMEAVTIEKQVKNFLETHKDLVRQRQALLNEFEEGVQTGRRELAGVLGKLFLREGMRIQGENLALKRQNSLLKSIADETPERTSGKKKKAKRKKKKNNNAADITTGSANNGSQVPSNSPSPKLEAEDKDQSIDVNAEASPPEPTPLELDGKDIEAAADDATRIDNDQGEVTGNEVTTEEKSQETRESLQSEKHLDTPLRDHGHASTQDDQDKSDFSAHADKEDAADDERLAVNEPDTEKSRSNTPTKQINQICDISPADRWNTPQTTKINDKWNPISLNQSSTLPINSPASTNWGPFIGQETPRSLHSSNTLGDSLARNPLWTSLRNKQPGPTFESTQPPPAFVIPEQVRDMSHEGLLTTIQKLAQENNRLIQAMNAMQLEISRKQFEMSATMREREEQLVQFFEARRKNDLEQARRYIVSLEAQIQMLKEGGSFEQSSRTGFGAMAGFGNQDLFANYRQEVQSTHSPRQRLWHKGVRVRCGNCGEVGHASTECKASI